MVQRKDRQKKEFHDQSDYRQWCMLLMSSTNLSSHTGRHNKQFFHSAAGNAKIYLKNYNIIPRLTLLMETFIHTYHHSFTILSDKSIYTVSLPWKLSDFLDTSFSWTLSFPQGPYFSSFFLWGPLSISPSSVRGSPTHRYNSADLRTRLPGCVDHQVCSTYVSTPQGQPSGPGPGCYL